MRSGGGGGDGGDAVGEGELYQSPRGLAIGSDRLPFMVEYNINSNIFSRGKVWPKKFCEAFSRPFIYVSVALRVPKSRQVNTHT